jgi:hypothetical protein
MAAHAFCGPSRYGLWVQLLAPVKNAEMSNVFNGRR